MIDKPDLNEPFEITVKEDNAPNRPYIEVYHGLINSVLLDGFDKLLVISFMMFSDTSETDTINTSTVSISKICQKTKMSKPTVCKHIKSLEEKGVLIKQHNSTPDSGKMANTYKLLNYISVWDCKTLEELKMETDKIKSEVLKND